jgi:hypothetical protein
MQAKLPSFPASPDTADNIFNKALREHVLGPELNGDTPVVSPASVTQNVWLSNNVTKFKLAKLHSHREDLIQKIISEAKRRDGRNIYAHAMQLLELTETLKLLTDTSI